VGMGISIGFSFFGLEFAEFFIREVYICSFPKIVARLTKHFLSAQV
jgi:hypothetical protein